MTVDAGRADRSFGVGTVLGTTFSMFFGRLGFYASLAIVTFLPAMLIVLAMPSLFSTGSGSGEFVTFAVAGFVSLFCGSLLVALTTYAVVMEANGRKVTISETFAAAAPRIGAVILASLVVTVIIALFSLLLVIPGLIAMTILWVAIPVVVAERMGPLKCLGRSSTLTKGHRWAIFGIVIILAILSGVTDAMVQMALMSVVRDPSVLMMVGYVIEALVQGISAIAAAYGFFLLKAVKEGAGPEELARVFE